MVSGFSDRFNSPFAPFLQDECSFVSLRDVERAVQVTSWFHQKMGLFLPLIKEFEEDRGIPLNMETRLQVSIPIIIFFKLDKISLCLQETRSYLLFSFLVDTYFSQTTN